MHASVRLHQREKAARLARVHASDDFRISSLYEKDGRTSHRLRSAVIQDGVKTSPRVSPGSISVEYKDHGGESLNTPQVKLYSPATNLTSLNS